MDTIRSLSESAAWGTVSRSGSILNEGSRNWEVSKRSTGVYLITVNGTFADRPVIVVSGYRETDHSQDNVYNALEINNEVFEVHSYDMNVKNDIDGKAQDAAFSFFALRRLPL